MDKINQVLSQPAKRWIHGPIPIHIHKKLHASMLIKLNRKHVNW
jgi:hypothetical protein